MNPISGFLITVSMVLFMIPPATAGEYGWMDDMNVEARADLSRFRARLATRFHLGDVEIEAVLGKVGRHADAYLVLRLHEMSGRPIAEVVDHYHANKGKGWGVVAKSLGIKPGSQEFHALKAGHDLEGYSHHLQGGGKGKGNGNNKGQHKDKPNKKDHK